jgi:hypothetical protein
MSDERRQRLNRIGTKSDLVSSCGERDVTQRRSPGKSSSRYAGNAQTQSVHTDRRTRPAGNWQQCPDSASGAGMSQLANVPSWCGWPAVTTIRS